MSAVLEKATAYAEGKYVVVASGVDFATDKDTAECTVEAQAVNKLEIVPDRYQQIATAKLEYKAYDQYGDEMTVPASDLTFVAFNVTQGKAVTPTATPNEYDLTETGTNAVKIKDVIKSSVILNKDTTVRADKEIPVENIAVKTVVFGEPILPEGTARLYAGTADVVVPITATDDLGKPFKFAELAAIASGGDVQGVVFSYDNITAMAINAEGNLVITAQNVGAAKIKAVIPATAAVVEKTLTVVADPAPQKVTFSAPETPIRVGVADAKLPAVVFDQYGDQMEASELVNYALATGFTVSVTPSAGAPSVTGFDAEGKNIVVDAATGATKGTYKLNLISTLDGTSSSYDIVIIDEAAAVGIEFKVKPAATGTIGQDFKIHVITVDQDGKEITSGSSTINYTSTLTSYADAAPFDAPTGTIDTNEKTFTFAVASSGKVTLQLKDGTNDVGTPITFDLNVVAKPTNISVATDKTEYKTGETITLTVKAVDTAGKVVTLYNKSGIATIAVGSASYSRNATFTEGIMAIDAGQDPILAKAVGTNQDVKVTFDSINTGTAPKVAIVANAATKLKVEAGTADGQLTISATDAYENVDAKFVGEKIVKVTAVPAPGAAYDGLDADSQIVATFTAGKTSDLVVNSAAFASGTVITVVADELTGTYTAP